jgi:type VI secretion system protein ImpH
MAGETRAAADPVAVSEALLAQPHAFDFFEAMRRIECAWPALPRLGTAARPVDEPVRLGHSPTLHFPASMLASVETIADGRLRILGYFLGLFGPQGPLPLHLTEYAHDRMTNARDGTFTAFADIFHHRMLELFYRAWADVRPTVHFDRPHQDRFATYVGALIGIANPTLRNCDAWPDRAKLHFAGLLSAATRTRASLEQLLREYLDLPVQVEECIGQWLQIAPDEYTRLGGDRGSATLGHSAVLGERVWNVQHKVRLAIGPVAIGSLMQYLPGSPSLERLRALMLNYLGFEYAWDVRFRVCRERIPGVRLGQFGHLGWTSWSAPRATGEDLDDVIITVPERANAA